ncbi:unnamed protein product [Caenorhabditis bovis]|uniref:Uncharacterized protein n=1 Tax=Caenorhabditis bovis TaxID=2654633 RepID=A0A8S1EDX8_9PELO|nr:unnamed protein product [Caenorhabditis bovis]
MDRWTEHEELSRIGSALILRTLGFPGSPRIWSSGIPKIAIAPYIYITAASPAPRRRPPSMVRRFLMDRRSR